MDDDDDAEHGQAETLVREQCELDGRGFGDRTERGESELLCQSPEWRGG